jgi:hypothetical protein
MPTQHRADGSGRDPDAQVLELALDALVTPARVLPGQADDHLPHLSVQTVAGRCGGAGRSRRR